MDGQGTIINLVLNGLLNITVVYATILKLENLIFFIFLIMNKNGI